MSGLPGGSEAGFLGLAHSQPQRLHLCEHQHHQRQVFLMSLAEGNGIGGAEPEVVDFALQTVVDAVEAIDLLGQLRPGAQRFLPVSELVGLGREADVGVGPDGAVLRTAELRGHEVISSLAQ